ncbi:hypothetical protein EV421DRAFT_1892448 [Armillaria borealis]|uniref:Uncharacterized protein n=1 Tax=Armillaria borealis TaxID=47425 RepID=A0AA39MJG9_9AGAR|nr:hypothetical protein EV421DRAFT_1892448 [Armillaria borealis]
MLLDIIDNLPRLWLSTSQIRIFLWMLRELGIHNMCGSEPVACKSSTGNVFYVNDLRDSIARDMSNPEVTKHLQFYPEDTEGGPVSEVWQANRWKEFDPSELTPINSSAPSMPNPLRALAQGDDLYVIMVPLWGDDVSGNKSKQYNKHINIYMANSCLPGQLLQQEYFVRFVLTSPHATSPEQFAALCDQINDTHTNPIKCYYARDGGRNCHVILRAPGLPADNPQQSEEASHMGGNANHPCRKCKVGGTGKEKESDDIYEQFYSPGEPRNAKEIHQNLEEQILWAMYGIDKDVAAMQTNTGTKDKVAQHWIDTLLEKAKSIVNELTTWLKEQPGDKINPLLDIAGLDPSQDTPVELLHTVLLGIIKYVWHMLNTSWTGYMIQYRNNLIGKHFKTLMQTLPFHVHGLVTPTQFTLIKAVSALSPLLWVHEIPNMEEYLCDVETLVRNVLDAFGDEDPVKIIIKIKLHLLAHITEDIPRFGPPIRNSTEVFEGFNAIFRLCSVLSNRQAPSRDIALKFASMDRLKHMLSGGFWKDHDHGWVQAGPSVLKVLRDHPILQRHLGWVPASAIEPVPQLKAFNMKAYHCLRYHQKAPSGESQWCQAACITAQNGDRCTPGQLCTIASLIIMTSNLDGIIIVDLFSLGKNLHPDLQCPVLCRPITNSQAEVLAPTNLLFMFNAQHDCRMAQCKATAVQACVQEWQVTDKMEKLVAHEDEDHFIINMFALHNAMLLRSMLPHTLISPSPLYTDRKMHHLELAKKLRETQRIKRAKTQEKRKMEIEIAERIAQEEWEPELEAQQSSSKEEGEEMYTQASKRSRTS